MCLLAICVPLEKCLFKFFAHLWIGQVGFFCCCWALRVLYIFWILIPYHMYDLQIFFPIFVIWLFTLLVVFLDAHILFMKYILSFFVCLFHIQKSLPNPMSWSWRFSPMFFLCFIILAFAFSSLIYFELMFIHELGRGPASFFSTWIYPVFLAPFVEKAVLSSLDDLGSLVKNHWLYM